MLGARAATQALADALQEDPGCEPEGGEASDKPKALDSTEVAAESDGEDEQMIDSDEEEDVEEIEAAGSTKMVPSLFRHRSSTVWFDYHPALGFERTLDREKLSQFEHAGDSDYRLLLRTEGNLNCISQTLRRHGFGLAEKGQPFNVHWGGYLPAGQLSKMAPEQVTNHFPGSFVLGRKDALWAALSTQMRSYGTEYDFVAKTYILPRDRKLMKHDFEELGKRSVFIIKPPNAACGMGIKLVTRYEHVPRKKRLVVQRYIGKPFLIDKKKFDLRLYVVVTSFDPLRVYLYEDGLVRFATHDYKDVRPGHKKDTKDRFMHLTNYSVNKNSEDFVQPDKHWSQGQATGSKWTLKQLWARLRSEYKHVDVDLLIDRIKDLCVKTLIAAEPAMVSRCNHSRVPRGSAFEIYGFDVLLDSALKPWLLEVNVFPSLSSSSPLDKVVKHGLMSDVFHLLGLVPFDRNTHRLKQNHKDEACYLPQQRERKWQFTSKSVIELEKVALSSISSIDDLEIIMESEDELRRCGQLCRVFPCPQVDYYVQFFSCKRYMNTLLWKWTRNPDWNLLVKYLRDPTKAPSLPNTESTRAIGAPEPSKSESKTKQKILEAVSREKQANRRYRIPNLTNRTTTNLRKGRLSTAPPQLPPAVLTATPGEPSSVLGFLSSTSKRNEHTNAVRSRQGTPDPAEHLLDRGPDDGLTQAEYSEETSRFLEDCTQQERAPDEFAELLAVPNSSYTAPAMSKCALQVEYSALPRASNQAMPVVRTTSAQSNMFGSISREWCCAVDSRPEQLMLWRELLPAGTAVLPAATAPEDKQQHEPKAASLWAATRTPQYGAAVQSHLVRTDEAAERQHVLRGPRSGRPSPKLRARTAGVGVSMGAGESTPGVSTVSMSWQSEEDYSTDNPAERRRGVAMGLTSDSLTVKSTKVKYLQKRLGDTKNSQLQQYYRDRQRMYAPPSPAAQQRMGSPSDTQHKQQQQQQQQRRRRRQQGARGVKCRNLNARFTRYHLVTGLDWTGQQPLASRYSS
eukprot:TRINITY_DN24_c0_g1_i6.p1 TRINITY_DN24_c0_g1~~TRINITY_DN24_c0_g1_i6.p1  ORF type:complete len:1019 (+),score=215.20 TRINITY_DN24_c0_g1_i6:337-3393(+)